MGRTDRVQFAIWRCGSKRGQRGSSVMARQKHLKAALNEKSRLRDLVQPGMAAFAHVDFKLIAEDQRTRIGDSLDLDAASKDEDPQSNRWDYIVSIPDLEKLIG